MDNNTQNPLDQLDGELNTPDASENVASNTTGSASQDAIIEPSTLQAKEQNLAPEVPQVPTAPVAPPIEPTPVYTVPVTAPISVKTELSEQDFRVVSNKRREETAKRLASQIKVWFMVPATPGEAKGLAYETVTIDGLRMEIKKGVMVEIPKQVAEILAEKYRIELTAGREKRIDGSQERIDALS